MGCSIWAIIAEIVDADAEAEAFLAVATIYGG